MSAPPVSPADVRRGTDAGPAGRGGDRGAPRRGAGWPGDLALGVRLAVGGGRTSWARVALTAVGTGLGVAVLLVAVAVPSVLDRSEARGAARTAVPAEGRAEAAAPLVVSWEGTSFRGRSVDGYAVDARRPDAPVPPGLDRLPRDGEVVLSPALARLLASPDGEQLRPRFPGPVVGTIGDAGLTGPAELTYYRGARLAPAEGERVAAFGTPVEPIRLPAVLWVVVAVGSVVLLLPVLVFVAAATRIAAAARDRRLAAIRLLGADAGQVRRIAAGEALVGAVLGLLVGGAAFLAGRTLVERWSLVGVSLFAEDVAPPPAAVAALAVGVPALAVGAAVVALRRTVVEPLGVTRSTTGARRRPLWRVLPLVAGLALLAAQDGALAAGGSEAVEVAVVLGAGLVLVALPLLLPWLVERLVAGWRGGPLPWQLAVRRLQLDGGTAGRVVGGLAVVLAGAVALQTLLDSAAAADVAAQPAQPVLLVLGTEPGGADAVAASDLVAGVDGVSAAYVVEQTWLERGDDVVPVTVAPCEVLGRVAELGRCADGDAFAVAGERPVPPPGTGMRTAGRAFPVPDHRTVASRTASPFTGEGLLLTPAAAAPLDPAELSVHGEVLLAPGAGADAVERVRNAAFAVDPQLVVTGAGTSDGEDLAGTRAALLAASVLVLALAAASLLVGGLEQLRERRRPIAVLAAAGVPRRVLAASVLWQAAVPVAIALAVAVGTGLALAALVLRTVDVAPVVDPAGIALHTALAAGAALLVTVGTLPALRRATRPEGLRTA